jgi:hypothetical protein
MRLMSKEEFLAAYKRFIRTTVDESAVKLVEEIIKDAWDKGYEFRIQEEELNKGASF